MQLPKYKKKKRIKLKVCQYPDCKKDFWGHPIAKYCELHRDIKQRQIKKKDQEPLEARNMVFRHNYIDVCELPFLCCLPGCTEEFTLKIFPKQYVYPRFCMQHRNDYKRKHFQMMMRKKAREEEMRARLKKD